MSRTRPSTWQRPRRRPEVEQLEDRNMPGTVFGTFSAPQVILCSLILARP
jgi:hypothetical protein